ncbi:hypothetical protein [Streptomyces yerevanensis]|uniref:hypothetical protein n=1 Tax=Streptomyces yerevanensis TaxID=66378 RepID=UPI000526F310|nr:hypothetical protein [Streptomyces yerevanensis]
MREPPSYAIARSADVALDPGLEDAAVPARNAEVGKRFRERLNRVPARGHVAPRIGSFGETRQYTNRGWGITPTTGLTPAASAVPAGSLAPTTVAVFPLRTPPADVRADGRMA